MKSLKIKGLYPYWITVTPPQTSNKGTVQIPVSFFLIKYARGRIPTIQINIASKVDVISYFTLYLAERYALPRKTKLNARRLNESPPTISLRCFL